MRIIGDEPNASFLLCSDCGCSGITGRLTRSLPLTRSRDLPVHVARLPPAPFCETPTCGSWLSGAWARRRSKRGRSVRAWRGGWQRTWCRRRPRDWGAWLSLVTPSNSHRINTPALTGPSVIASHSPPEPTSCRVPKDWQVHYRRDEASRVAAPC